VILSSASFGEDVSETEAGLCRARIKERIGMKMGKKEVLREERRKKREMGVTGFQVGEDNLLSFKLTLRWDLALNIL